MPLPSTVDQIHELTEHHQQRTPFERDIIATNGSSTRYTEVYVTNHEPLITQLAGSEKPASQGGEVGAATPSSKPAAHLDALDAVALIDHLAHAWLDHLGQPARLDTIAAVRRVGSLLPRLDPCPQPRPDCCEHHELARDIRRWWIRARVLTGWESPAWKPDATCPVCGERRTVMIRMTSEVATCTHCRETWDADTIGLLAEHVRFETEQARVVRPIATACAPTDELDDAPRMMLCPDCGSARCVKVLEQTIRPITARSPSAPKHRRRAS
ncbi:MAG: hypothetical protein QM621_15060 [Aeromicrobium sp.]|uniref:hypothetical protein n=1 Tax=Aeromicrobium sp. TaxID=1871063 RepID=UPI0039E32D2D